MRVGEHESLEELQAVTKRERDGRVRLRLQGVVLARQGRSARVIGQSLGVSPRPARAWVRRCLGAARQPGWERRAAGTAGTWPTGASQRRATATLVRWCGCRGPTA